MMKKFTALTLMMAALMFTSIAQADYTINPFVVCDATGNQAAPDIDGDWIVWQDERVSSMYPHIYGHTLAESLEIEICTDSGTSQIAPVISGNKVLWRDDRDDQWGNSQRDIYAFDLLSQTPLTELNMPFEDGVYQQDPDISGNLTVYRHDGSYKNIYVYDSDQNTNQLVSAASTHQYEPAIDGTIAAWVEVAGVPQVYYRNIGTWAAVETVGSGSYTQRYPAVSDGVIVWEEDRGGSTGKDIYGYDPGTGIFPICTASGNQELPAISGNIVAWQDDADGNGVYDIWAIDLDDMAAGCFEVSDGIGDNRSPAVSGNTIVWQRSGDIYGAQLLDPSEIIVTAPNGGGVYLAAASMLIEWTHTGPVDEVLIEFSSNGGSNWTDVNTVENTGSYLWDPIADVDSADCWIRVTNTANLTATDTSDSAFEIYQIPDSITVIDPNGGEQFLAGSAMEIRWAKVGEFSHVKIMFSPDDEQSWQIVTDSTENDGVFTWDAVPADANSIQCLIHVSDVADSSTWDMNDSWFTVFQCDVNLTADLTGDCFVGLADFAEMALQWLLCGNPYDEDWCFE